MARMKVFEIGCAVSSICLTCLLLGPASARPSVSTIEMIQCANELNSGEEAGLISAEKIAPRLFTTSGDVLGFFEKSTSVPSDETSPNYVGPGRLRDFEEALWNFAVISEKSSNWRRFGTALQLQNDILCNLAKITVPKHVLDDTGTVQIPRYTKLALVFAISAGIDGERHVVDSVIQKHKKTFSCLSPLASKLKKLDGLASGYVGLNSSLKHPSEQNMETQLQGVRTILGYAVKCLAAKNQR